MEPWFLEALLLLIFVVPLFIFFGYAVFDIIKRHDIGLGHKAIWLLVFCIVPIIGPLVYLVVRPPGTTAQEERLAGDAASQAAELATLADLHDRGKLSDEEFSHFKAQHADVAHEMPGSVREQRGSQLL